MSVLHRLKNGIKHSTQFYAQFLYILAYININYIRFVGGAIMISLINNYSYLKTWVPVTLHDDNVIIECPQQTHFNLDNRYILETHIYTKFLISDRTELYNKFIVVYIVYLVNG